MKPKRRMLLLPILATAAAALTSLRAQTARPNESGLAAVWKLNISESNDHARVASACGEFRKASPSDPLAWVADGIGAWRWLKAGDTSTAATVFERMAAAPQTDPMGKAAAVMAKRWLTRLDREKVRFALKLMYRKNIEFPPSLEDLRMLPEQFQPPYTDRWGQKWSYRLVEFKHLKGIRGQKYELISASLGASSDLETALAVPYASRIPLKPSRVIGGGAGSEAIEFATTDGTNEKKVLNVGSESDGIRFPYRGASLLVLSDGDHWLVILGGK